MRRILAAALLAFSLPAALLLGHVFRRLGGDWTRLYYVTAPFARRSGLHHLFPPGRITYANGPYDSLWFLADAADPLLRRRERNFYRDRRIAFPWAGWLLALGVRERLFYTLPLANLLVLALATAWLARELARRGRPWTVSLLLPLQLGAAVCLVRPLADLFGTSLLLLGLLAWAGERRLTAAFLFAAAGLAKETLLLAPAVLAARALAGRRLREALPLALPFAVCALWWGYVLLRSPHPDAGVENLSPPFTGILARLAAPMGKRETLAFAATLGSILLAFLLPRGPLDPIRLVLLVFAVLALVTGEPVWEEFWAYGRVHLPIPSLFLLLYARTGRLLDLAAPAACALASLVVWW